LKGSSTFRSHRTVLVLLAALTPVASALDPNRAPSQYLHDHWGPGRGFPSGPVYGITQTPDGYLWIAAEAGLIRFDGVNFRLMPGAARFSYGASALGLTADRDGNLWVRLLGPLMVVFRNGAFENPMSALGFNNVSAMSQSSDGGLLAAAMEHGALTYRDGRFAMVASADTLPRSPVMAIAQTSDGTIWIGTRDAGLFRVAAGRSTAIRQGLPDPKVNCLLADGERGLWIGTDNGIVRWDGSGFSSPVLLGAQALSLARDRDGNLWAGTSEGLTRVNADGVVALDRGPGPSGAVTAVFEDREGNLWIGSGRGLERLRDGVFVTLSETGSLPPGSGALFTGARDQAWFAPASGGLYRIADGRVERVAVPGLDRDIVYSIAGTAGDLWLGRQRGGLTRLHDGSVTTYSAADGLAENSVFAVHQGRDGSVWAGTLTGGLSRLREGRFTTYTTRDGLPSDTVSDLLEAADGTIWIATPGGLGALAGGQWRTFRTGDGLPSDAVNCVFEDRAGILWAGTSKGLVYRRSGAFHKAGGGNAALGEPVLGLAEDLQGAIWIATAKRVVRASRAALLAEVLRPGDLREYGPADGLSQVEGVKRHHAVTSDARGRVWFSLTGGISVVDPARLAGEAAPAIAQVQSVSADGQSLTLGNVVRVRDSRQRIEFTFAGLSLSVPERIQFRYRLDAFDHDWSVPVTARQAVYTNLNPGWYRFRVVACNADGVWSAAEAGIALHIQPLLWETWWFRVSAALACALAGFTAYRIRLRRMAARLNFGFEERLAERTRIAQELHDTMLQGFLSASMQLQLAADNLEEGSPARPSVNRILQVMSQVIDEGRNAIRGIRLHDDGPDDLTRAFSSVRNELGAAAEIDFRITVDGDPRPLHPLVRDDVYRLGREALCGAFRRAGDGRVEMQLEYTRKRFRILVRDDGVGIDSPDAPIRQSLAAMRARAEKLGGRFTVYSSPSAGTEVEITVPSYIAFRRQSRNGDH
jgi:ligand-binding sensor domain-containing protein